MSKSTESVRNFSIHKENEIVLAFPNLIYQTTIRTYSKNQIHSLLSGMHIAQFFIIFLNFKTISVVDPKFLIPPLYVALSMVGVLAIIFLQIILGLIYKR